MLDSLYASDIMPAIMLMLLNNGTKLMDEVKKWQEVEKPLIDEHHSAELYESFLTNIERRRSENEKQSSENN